LKQLIKRLLPVALSIAVILPASSAYAASYVKGSNVLYGSNGFKIELLQQTDIYNDPTDAHPIAALAPQTVSGLTEAARSGAEGHWYKVETWLGAKWIYAVREIVRDSEPFKPELVMVSGFNSGFGNDEFYRIHVEGALYDEPFEDAKISWASLGKQNNVQAVDYAYDFNSGWGWYKVKTFIGEKWVHKLRQNPPKV
jgi:hypothetical protein